MQSPGEWEDLRALARRNVEADRLKWHPSIRLTAIDDITLRATDAWRGPRRRADWDWRRVTKRPRDARFEVAIWNGGQLCGLAFGPVEGVIGMGHASLEYVEGRPDEHEFRGQIISIVLATLEEFGRIMDVAEVRLLGVKPALMSSYRRLGYDDMVGRPGTGYLRKRITRS